MKKEKIYRIIDDFTKSTKNLRKNSDTVTAAELLLFRSYLLKMFDGLNCDDASKQVRKFFEEYSECVILEQISEASKPKLPENTFNR